MPVFFNSSMRFTSNTNQTFAVITDMFVYERDTNNALRDQIYTLREKLRASESALAQERLKVDKLRSEMRDALEQLTPHTVPINDILDVAASKVLFRRQHVRGVVQQALETYYAHLERIVSGLYAQLAIGVGRDSSRRASKLIKH